MIRQKTEEEARTHTNKEVSDEEILNIYRQSDKPFLQTGDVVKELPIGKRAVQKRLKQLEEEGRLESESVGSAIIRWLAEDESQDPIWGGGAKYFRWSNKVVDFGNSIRKFAVWSFAASGFLMLAAVGVELTFAELLPLSADQLVIAVVVLLYFGGIAVILWGGNQCAGYILKYIGGYKNDQQRPRF